jgi:hypothetical protein
MKILPKHRLTSIIPRLNIQSLIATLCEFFQTKNNINKMFRERLNFYQTTMSNRHGNYAPIDEFDLITQPVPLDFSFETEDERRYSKRTPAPIYLVRF